MPPQLASASAQAATCADSGPFGHEPPFWSRDLRRRFHEQKCGDRPGNGAFFGRLFWNYKGTSQSDPKGREICKQPLRTALATSGFSDIRWLGVPRSEQPGHRQPGRVLTRCAHGPIFCLVPRRPDPPLPRRRALQKYSQVHTLQATDGK